MLIGVTKAGWGASIPYGLFTAKLFSQTASADWKITTKSGVFYALDSLCMGFGTILFNVCNVGVLYTPIVNFSLSRWILLIVLVAAGILGNKVERKLNV
ncbi:YeeE/YedE thiosulfate transporter family protein [Peptostreptococcus sp. D1]|uniref:YeeE/YedE thiosulfate transporter family protein n=1 Tax=Peptostreptococcus sp. D1 TaxID=72304 RepID=UPI0008E185BA|nr:YeeE/YedE thiosulfate transporter family protein [Peptostreptococcus sp. D1]SFE20959.1 Sulphur transport [Peptostreptococcus sp. D1]